MCDLSWEAIAGLSSAVIALCALCLTVWQACVIRRHNRLSVTPHLTTWTHSDKKKNLYAVYLLNNGIGPALINNFRIKVDDRVISGEGTEPMKKTLEILFPKYSYRSYQEYVDKGYMVSIKETRNLLAIQFYGQNVPSSEEIDHAIQRVDLLVEYESIYQEKFFLDTATQKANHSRKKAPMS